MSKFLRTEVFGKVGIVNLDTVVSVGIETDRYGPNRKTYVNAHTTTHELDGSGGSSAYSWHLFQGTESECQGYIDWLCDEVDALEYTPPETEE